LSISHSDWADDTYDANVTSYSLAPPASMATDDLLYLLVLLEEWGGRVTTHAITPPAGLTELLDELGPSNDQRLVLYEKRVTGSEPGSYAFSFAGAVNVIGFTKWVRGSGGLVSTDVVGSFGTGTNNAPQAPGITAATGARVYGAWFNGGGEVGNAPYVPTSWTADPFSSGYQGLGHRDISGATGNLSPAGNPLDAASNWSAFLWSAVEAAGGGPSAAVRAMHQYRQRRA
jgi:hypothetical protein